MKMSLTSTITGMVTPLELNDNDHDVHHHHHHHHNPRKHAEFERTNMMLPAFSARWLLCTMNMVHETTL
jgi:hypothetical protein